MHFWNTAFSSLLFIHFLPGTLPAVCWAACCKIRVRARWASRSRGGRHPHYGTPSQWGLDDALRERFTRQNGAVNTLHAINSTGAASRISKISCLHSCILPVSVIFVVHAAFRHSNQDHSRDHCIFAALLSPSCALTSIFLCSSPRSSWKASIPPCDSLSRLSCSRSALRDKSAVLQECWHLKAYVSPYHAVFSCTGTWRAVCYSFPHFVWACVG